MTLVQSSTSAEVHGERISLSLTPQFQVLCGPNHATTWTAEDSISKLYKTKTPLDGRAETGMSILLGKINAKLQQRVEL